LDQRPNIENRNHDEQSNPAGILGKTEKKRLRIGEECKNVVILSNEQECDPIEGNCGRPEHEIVLIRNEARVQVTSIEEETCRH
jgi:hypothetical protein